LAAVKGDSKERILNAAEILFAAIGFDGTSTRDIAAKSKSTLGTLSHHFKSKNDLLLEIIKKRFPQLDRLRRDTYQSLVASVSGTPALELTVASIVLPYVDRAMGRDAGWRSYTLLIGRLVRSHNAVHRKFVRDLLQPYQSEYYTWLQKALPDASVSEIRYAYDLTISCMIGACAEVEFARKNDKAAAAASSGQFQETASRLLRFIIAGISASVTDRSSITNIVKSYRRI
jgi:AcrR family transcriptional regulator